MAKDVVCHMEIEEVQAAAKSEYRGITYYFCGIGCQQAFEREPEEYVAEEGGGDRQG